MDNTVVLTLQFFFLAIGKGGAEGVDLFSQILVVFVIELDVVVLYASVVEDVACSATLQVDSFCEEEHWVLLDEAFNVLLNGFFIQDLTLPNFNAILSPHADDLTTEFVVEKNCNWKGQCQAFLSKKQGAEVRQLLGSKRYESSYSTNN